MKDLLKGRFTPKNKVAIDTDKKETLEDRFERATKARLGGSVAWNEGELGLRRVSAALEREVRTRVCPRAAAGSASSGIAHCFRNWTTQHLAVSLRSHSTRIVRWFGEPRLHEFAGTGTTSKSSLTNGKADLIQA